MNNMHDKIQQYIKKDKHLLLYKQPLYNIYKIHDKKYNPIYISTPKKGKTAIELILKKVDEKQHKEFMKYDGCQNTLKIIEENNI